MRLFGNSVLFIMGLSLKILSAVNRFQVNRFSGNDFLRLIASGFGIGRIPVAPGTAGSLLALPLWYLGGGWGAAHFLLLAAVVGASVPAARAAIEKAGTKDPSWVVIDEVAGMLLAATGIPWEWPAVAVLFLLFRLFDIFKFGPAAWMDARRDALGVVADDLAAGIYANVSYRALRWLIAAWA